MWEPGPGSAIKARPLLPAGPPLGPAEGGATASQPAAGRGLESGLAPLLLDSWAGSYDRAYFYLRTFNFFGHS